jgi:hypothetical protein
VSVELVRRLADELQPPHEPLELRVDVHHARPREPWVAIGHPERQPRHDLDRDRERLAAQRERPVLGVQPERILVAALVAQPHESLAAEVEQQPALARRPGRGRGDLRMLEPAHAGAFRPGRPEGQRPAVERPVLELDPRPVQPAAQLVGADDEPVPALSERERAQPSAPRP